MQILNEIIHDGAYIVSEAQAFFSRETIAISNAVLIVSGTVLGKAGAPGAMTATAAPASDNAGNGTLTMDATAPLTSDAVDGAYIVEMTSPTTFNVLSPKGTIVGKGTVGTVYSGPLKFMLVAGSSAFVINDRFTVTVLRPDGVADVWSPLAVGGEAAGVLFTTIRVATSPGIQKAVAHTRQSEVRASDLTWPAGFTAAQIAEGTLQLKRIGIILR